DAAADEGTQETFVRAHQRLQTIQDHGKLQGWLFGIARMVSFEHLRRKRRDALPAQLVEEPVQVDQAPSPEAVLLSAESDRALDELPRDRAAQVEAHAAACPQCASELSWLRAEQTLLARRPPAQTAHLWAAIAARLRHPRRRPHRAWRISVGAAVAAAAAVVLVVTVRPRPEPVARQATRQQRERPAIDPKALAALDRAEADYKDAAKVLEAEYARLRPRLDPEMARRWDET